MALEDYMTLEGAAQLLQAVAAFLFIVLAIRIAVILSHEPANEMLQELVYLRAEDMRRGALAILLLLLLVAVSLLYPFLVSAGFLTVASTRFYLYLGLVEGVLLVAAGAFFSRVAAEYSPRGFDRRLRDNLERMTAQAERRRK